MARPRDKSPSLMDDDFPMRRHGIQFCPENEVSHTAADEDDDVIFVCEEKKKKDRNHKKSRNNSSSSSTGSENSINNVDSAVNMDRTVNRSRKTKNNNSWSSESSVDVETVSPPPPPRVPDASTQPGNDDEEEIIVIHYGTGTTPRSVETSRCGDKRPHSLPVVDFESDPQQNSSSRKRPIDPASQSLFLDKRSRGGETDSHEQPSWLMREEVNYERRPITRWDNPSVDNQTTPVQLQGWESYSAATQPNPSSTPRQAMDENDGSNNTNSTRAVWNPIMIPNVLQTGMVQGQNHRSNISQVTNASSQAINDSNRSHNTVRTSTAVGTQAAIYHEPIRQDNVYRSYHLNESQVASTLSQANQEGSMSNGHADASNCRINGPTHEGRSKERERHSSGNTRGDRSRSKERSRSRSCSRSMERRRRDSRNRSRSRERRRSQSPFRDQRERRPSGLRSGYPNLYAPKERRVSGNSNHSHSSHSSERAWRNHHERGNHKRNSNYRGRGVGNGRCTPQAGTSDNYHKPRKENYSKYGNQEWLHKNKGGFSRGYKGGNDSGYRNDQRGNGFFDRGQETQNTSSNLISPNFIPSNNHNIWGDGQHSKTTSPRSVSTNTRQIPETETSTSSLRQDNISPRQDPPSNILPQPDKEDYYPPISQIRHRIAHKNAMGNANGANNTPAAGSGLSVEKQIRQHRNVLTNSTQTRKSSQTNSATTNEAVRNHSSANSENSVFEILKLIKTCSNCHGRMFDDRKKAMAHLLKDHQKKLCYVCFKAIPVKGVEYKQHFIEHTNNDRDELAQCPLCHEKHKMEGLYIHMSKVHFIPIENTKPKPTGEIISKQTAEERKRKIYSPKPSPGTNYQHHRRQQFDPQRSSSSHHCSNSKLHRPHQYRSKIDWNKRQVVDSELSGKTDTSSPESDRNGNDVEHNLIYAPREDIRSFRIPKKKPGEIL